MKLPLAILTALTLIGTPAFADPGQDESGHGRWRGDHRAYVDGRDYKEEIRVGGCKVEREWESDGDYKEEWECDNDRDD